MSILTMRYEIRKKFEYSNDFDSLIKEIKRLFSIKEKQLIILQFTFYKLEGEKFIVNIENDKDYQTYKKQYENKCKTIEFKIANLREIKIGQLNKELLDEGNSEYFEEIKKMKEEINKLSEYKKFYEIQKNEIKDLKVKIRIIPELQTQVQFLSKQLYKLYENYDNLINSNVWENNNKNIINNLKQLIKEFFLNKINTNYSCKFIQNEDILIDKKNLTPGFTKKYKIKVYNNSKDNLNWPEDTFIRCINEDSDIFFLPSKIKEIDKENNDNIVYLFSVEIIFKNYNSDNYSLKYQLISDNNGEIGNDIGELKIKLIAD